MTKKGLAERFNVSRQTISNWEKEKPELIYLINLGLEMEKLIENEEKRFKALELIRKKCKILK
ncbi:hypothetical protein [Sulfuricurvum sp.]|uniref:hypothetical protein n=1 Tax=Sulfuricurvum sp. TaxID=2025608 RepID=UPI00261C54F3|nr:hypothetical protein [Sulfuricurvum sp.]MDD3596991.1 hypothetical protein [Sulfuricurvum sp.]